MLHTGKWPILEAMALNRFGPKTQQQGGSGVEGGQIHPTAIVEGNVVVGAGTHIWDHVHIRKNSVIGEHCIIGEKTYIAYDVVIGSKVKLNAFVYVCTGVTMEDQVMVGAGTIFTNDRFPRAFDRDGRSLKSSNPDDSILETHVGLGSSIGAGCVIGPGVNLGRYCMVGMGSVVTRNVLPHQLVYGNPARHRGFMCICGGPLPIIEKTPLFPADEPSLACSRCGRQYRSTESHPIYLSDLYDSNSTRSDEQQPPRNSK